MIKAVLIDDERHIRDDIREKLDRSFSSDIRIVGEAEGIEQAKEIIETHNPELLFLDIQLKDGTGFDLLNNIDVSNLDVIFITGFDQHAIKAIRVGALDYILKPVDEEELVVAVTKAIDNHEKENHLQKLIEVSTEFFKGAEKKRVILKTSDNVYAIYERDILYCKSDGNYTTFYTQNMERIVVSKPIKKIEEILTEDVFIRCHQSYIVNKEHVLKYNRNGVLVIHMDIKVPVSSRRKDYALKKIFD